jgi:hypothetical protein
MAKPAAELCRAWLQKAHSDLLGKSVDRGMIDRGIGKN